VTIPAPPSFQGPWNSEDAKLPLLSLLFSE
jgi:hypothetical protein